MTHTVPKNMNGQILDPTKDINGPHSKCQKIANEKNVTTVRNISSDFNQNKKATDFVQENSHTQAIVSNLPMDSAIK